MNDKETLDENFDDQLTGFDEVHFRISDVMDNASDLIQSCDTEGCLLFANKCWQETLGYTEGEVAGMNVFEVIHPTSKDHCMELVQKIDKLRSVNDEPVTLITREGKPVYTRANINCQYDSDGNPKGTQAIFRDVTETELVKQRIEAAEIRYQMLVESANDVIYQGDVNGNLLFANEPAIELTGYPIEELVGLNFQDLVQDDFVKQVSLFYARQVRDRINSTYLEFPVKRKDGSPRWVGQTIRLLTKNDSTDELTGFMGVMRDITHKHKYENRLIDSKKELENRVRERTAELLEANDQLQIEIEGRKNMERYLHESKQEYERLFQNAHDAIIIFKAEDELVLEVNQRACQLYGIEREEFIGMSLEKISTNIPHRKSLIEKTISKKDYSHFEIDQKTPSGKLLILEINALPIVYMGQKAILSINRDVTKRHELNKKLEQERTERITSLIDGQEIERRRFAKELHDGLGQMLTASVHHLRKIKRLGELSKEQQTVLKETEEMSQQIIEETRRISKNLMPSVLEDFGLYSALQNLVGSVSDASTNVSLSGCENTPRFDKEHEVSLFRIAQEALNNAIKYAEAASIEVKLLNEPERIVLIVSDNGRGFHLSVDQTSYGHGLSNMKERAGIIGADFTINSMKEKGTEVKIILAK